MGLSADGNPVAGYQYDGLKRRTVKQTYSAGVLSMTRDCYYSQGWQVLEQRINGATTPDRQFVWGLRYIDDIVLRDRDTTGDGTLDGRLYGMQDANWNVIALADTTGTVMERYAYMAYSFPAVLTPEFNVRTATLFDWELGYAGYRWDEESCLYQVRNRFLHPLVGWVQRDPDENISPDSLYEYVGSRPYTALDPFGLFDFSAFANSLRVHGAGYCFSGDILYIPLPFGLSLHITGSVCLELIVCCKNKATYGAWKILGSLEGYVQIGITWKKTKPTKGTGRNTRIPNPWNPGKTIKAKKTPPLLPGHPGFRERSVHVDFGCGLSTCPAVPSWSFYGTIFLRGSAGAWVGVQFNVSKTIRSWDDVTDFFSNWSAEGSVSYGVVGASLEAGVGVNVEGWFYLDGPTGKDPDCC